MSTPQEDFDAKYITTTEVIAEMGVSRCAVTRAVGRGSLPQPISVGTMNLSIWERSEMTPAMQAWKDKRNV